MHVETFHFEAENGDSIRIRICGQTATIEFKELLYPLKTIVACDRTLAARIANSRPAKATTAANAKNLSTQEELFPTHPNLT